MLGCGQPYPAWALIQVHTLTDGGQMPVEIARLVAEFVAPVRETLELALYDIRLHDDTAEIVRGALVGAHERGIHVRLVYNVDKEDARPPVPPPPKTDPSLIETLPFETAAVAGWPDLMHHKYIVRDREAVWSGSTNWTDDSWSREENVIVVVESTGVAIRFQEDFAQLWKKREVAKSGRVPTDAIHVGDAQVRTWFSPKRGEKLAARIAHAVSAAERRVRVASPIVTSGPNRRARSFVSAWAIRSSFGCTVPSQNITRAPYQMSAPRPMFSTIPAIGVGTRNSAKISSRLSLAEFR